MTRPRANSAASSVKDISSVFVADETTLLREGIAAICEASGRFHVVGHCGDGVSALRMILTLAPRIALIDVDLPGLPGLGVVREARKAGSHCRFLCSSRKKDRRTVLDVLRNGANGFVLKSDSACQLLTAFAKVMSGGVYVSPQMELAELFVPPHQSRGGDPLDTLSPREQQVFSLLVEGLRAKEIAARMRLSPKTVDTYRASLMKKLDVPHLAGLVKYAVLKKLISLP